ncbi:hypothetical protein HYT17_03795 [Candidatus Microgenomates bacterium]|nr:hypothetical protein [Candidatus Microgenomates bacterium]
MTKGKRKSKYDKARDKAYNYYFQRWRGNEKITPAFKQKVRVTRSGWDHLINPFHKRTKAEQTRRFEILPLARKLLEEAQTFQEHRKNQFGHYFAFTGYIGGRKIKVVVRSKTFQEQKYFYSVMIVL